MARNEAAKIAIRSPMVGMPARYKVSYCRPCELACPVGPSLLPRVGGHAARD